MPKYLAKANYTPEGVKGLMKEGASGRAKAIHELVASAGGTVEGIYYAFGDTDLFVVLDAPDDEAATALSLIVNAAGVATSEVVKLLTPEQVDEAASRAVSYRPPGE